MKLTSIFTEPGQPPRGTGARTGPRASGTGASPRATDAGASPRITGPGGTGQLEPGRSRSLQLVPAALAVFLMCLYDPVDGLIPGLCFAAAYGLLWFAFGHLRRLFVRLRNLEHQVDALEARIRRTGRNWPIIRRSGGDRDVS